MNAVEFCEAQWDIGYEESRWLASQFWNAVRKIDTLPQPAVAFMSPNFFCRIMAWKLKNSRKLKPGKYRRFLKEVR